MRSAGILMPISSLPSPYGIGTMGQDARDFIKFLAASGQDYWQILPVCPTSYGDSPYQSYSSFAGNLNFIDFDDLYSDGLLDKSDYIHIDWGDNEESIDYGKIYKNRYTVLKKACKKVIKTKNKEFVEFCNANQKWLDDYSLFMAIKEYFYGLSWLEWPDEIRIRDEKAIKKITCKLADEIEFNQAVQFLFFSQWKKLKDIANESGIKIIGDLPIYVSYDSADVWVNPEQFQLDDQLIPKEVAGCPPDAFSDDGQLWGNPLFNWKLMKEQSYKWWMDRISYQFNIYDVLRIDHFRGFDSYYAIPYGAKDGKKGRWRRGPGYSFFREVEKNLGQREIIAEDLGLLTDSVRKLLKRTKLPGMKVMEFAFSSADKSSDYLPHKYDENCIVYTGTHDNNTILGWIDEADIEDVEFATEYLGLNDEEGYNWGMMRGAWSSKAMLAVMQMQDLLGLRSEARMNIPSTVGENWKWRARRGSFTPELAEKIRSKMEIYGRLNRQKGESINK